MPRPCSVCISEHRDAVDRTLLTGASNRVVAHQFGLGPDAVSRHRNAHVAERLAKAEGAAEVASAGDLLAELRLLRAKAINLLLKAEAAGDYRTALAGIGQARQTIELLAELEGELDRRPVVNLTLSAEWIAVRATLVETLAPWPEARAAVAASLRTLQVVS
jgi:hypothetical protein